MAKDESPLPRFALLSDLVGDIVVRPYPRCIIAEGKGDSVAPTAIVMEPVTEAALSLDPFDAARTKRPLGIEGVRINADGTMEVDASDVLSALEIVSREPAPVAEIPPPQPSSADLRQQTAALVFDDDESDVSKGAYEPDTFRSPQGSLVNVQKRRSPAFVVALAAAAVLIAGGLWLGLGSGKSASAETAVNAPAKAAGGADRKAPVAHAEQATKAGAAPMSVDALPVAK